MTETDVLTIKQAAVFCHCSEKTIRRQIASGAITAFKYGGRSWLIKQATLEALKVTSTEETE